MSYTKSVYQKKCTKCAENKVGACNRHFFMFIADSKTEELYCRNIDLFQKKVKENFVDNERLDSNFTTHITTYIPNLVENPATD